MPHENYTQTDLIRHKTKYTNTQPKHDNNTQMNQIEGSTTTTDNYPLAHTEVDQSNYTRYLQNVPIEHMQIQPVGYTQNQSIE